MRRAPARLLRLPLVLALASALAPRAAPAQTPPPSLPPPAIPHPAAGAHPVARDQGATGVELHIPGELQVRYAGLSSIPLATAPGHVGEATELGQTSFAESWIRLAPRLDLGPRFRLLTQFDLARALVADSYTQAVDLSRDARNALLPYGIVDVRWAYVEWDTPVGQLRAGQQGFSAGLGILANDGTRTPLFGDYRLGDIVERVALAVRPAGRDTDLVVAAAGDLVYRDRTVDLTRGDVAWQGVGAVYWQDHRCRQDCERKRVGAFAAYRDTSFASGGFVRVLAADVSARWEWPQPDHVGRVFAGVELAGIAGSTDLVSVQDRTRQDVLQFGGAGEVGLERDGRYRVALEAGYASGDRNPLDDTQRQFTFNPSYRVGLVLFPEVVAWQTARSASIATDPSAAYRPARGAALLPSSGGVTGAAYLYPNARINLGRYFDVRGAMVIGMASTDWVDPTSVQTYGSARNYRGGDPTRRDLGLELDLGVNARYPLSADLALSGGLQGGILFPGHAFDGAAGAAMPPVGMLVARLGLAF